jgi:large conductance mechanosensitive channel
MPGATGGRYRTRFSAHKEVAIGHHRTDTAEQPIGSLERVAGKRADAIDHVAGQFRFPFVAVWEVGECDVRLGEAAPLDGVAPIVHYRQILSGEPNHMLSPKAPSWMSDFRKFIMRGNVVDLAVGIIIGAAFTGVVGSLVKDVFNPLLGLATGGVDFSNVFYSFNGQHYANLADAQKAGAPTLNFGLFINAIIQFLIVSFAVFWLVKVLTRLNVRRDEVAGPTKTEVLLGEIRDLLKSRT